MRFKKCPGLAIRIVGGEITRERANTLREADAIFLQELVSNNVYDEIGQAFAVLMPEVKKKKKTSILKGVFEKSPLKLTCFLGEDRWCDGRPQNI